MPVWVVLCLSWSFRLGIGVWGVLEQRVCVELKHTASSLYLDVVPNLCWAEAVLVSEWYTWIQPRSTVICAMRACGDTPFAKREQ